MLNNKDLHFPLESISDKDINVIRTLLNKYEYTDIGFKKLKVDSFRRSLDECIVLDYKLKDIRSRKEFISLFYLGKSVKYTFIKKILGDRLINRLRELNIICSFRNNTFRSNVMIIPFKSYFFASDFMFRYLDEYKYEEDDQIENIVYPVSRDSIDLWQALIKIKGHSVLDLGTGCGVLAILASLSCKYAVGIDLNQRAINFAQFNSFLNQVKNASFFYGDLYTPLKSEQFSIILSNPPSLISSTDNIKKLYEYGGKKGYDVIRKIIQGLPYYLKIGGYSQMAVVFFEAYNNMKVDLIKKWLGKYRSNFKILFLKLYETDPYQYAWIKSQDKLQFGWGAYQKAIKKQLDNLHKNGTKKIQYGILTIKHYPSYGFLYSEKEYINSIPLPDKPLDLIKNHFL